MWPREDLLNLKEFIDRHPVRNAEPFWEDDRGYRRWLEEHPTGYVFNVVKDGNLVLHRADCATLAGSGGTFGLKVCSMERETLESLCRAAVGGNPRTCSRCIGEQSGQANGTTRNFHLPLPADLYTQLQAEAERVKRPATAVARLAIAEWLRQRRRAAVGESIAAYVAEMTGSGVDLDPALEAASLECIAESERQAR